MNSRRKYIYILLVGTFVLMICGILLFLNNQKYTAFSLFPILLILSIISFFGIIKQGYREEYISNAQRIFCAFGYSALITLLTIFICNNLSNNFNNDAGVVYVLGKVVEKKQFTVHEKNNNHLEFEATIKVPTFGLGGLDTIVYEYHGREKNLNAPFPIKGNYALMKYSVAWPQNMYSQQLNEDIKISTQILKLKIENSNANITIDDIFQNSFNKYKTPVVVLPNGDTLTNDQAMNYIRNYINQKK